MIRNMSFRLQIAALGLLLASALSAHAVLPQPMCIYYGQVKDEFGWPYSGSHQGDVILRIGTNEITRHHVSGSLSPGVNFALYVPIDDGRGSAYVQYAAVTGLTVTIVVSDHTGERLIMETNSLPKVGKPGDIVAINVTAGTDADHDGIPDEWEEAVLYWSENPFIHSIEDLLPGDDLDGDHVSNWDEYIAGTLADDASDFFYAERGDRTANNCLKIEFYSVRGKTYRMFSSTDLGGPSWQVCGVALSDAGPVQLSPVEGDGLWLSLYIPFSETNRVFRMDVQ
jgi:hypothetical protein